MHDKVLCMIFFGDSIFQGLRYCCALLVMFPYCSLSRYCSTLLLQQVAGLGLLLGQSAA